MTKQPLTFRIAQVVPETDVAPATWVVQQLTEQEEWRRIAAAPSFETALVALFDVVPWTDTTSFSHFDVAAGITEFTFYTQEQPS